MTDSALACLSAAEQCRLIRSRKLSPVELVKVCRARIERCAPVLGAYITACGDAAMDKTEPVPPVCYREPEG